MVVVVALRRSIANALRHANALRRVANAVRQEGVQVLDDLLAVKYKRASLGHGRYEINSPPGTRASDLLGRPSDALLQLVRPLILPLVQLDHREEVVDLTRRHQVREDSHVGHAAKGRLCFTGKGLHDASGHRVLLELRGALSSPTTKLSSKEVDQLLNIRFRLQMFRLQVGWVLLSSNNLNLELPMPESLLNS